MAAPHSKVHICDPDNPDQIAKVNPDGSIETSSAEQVTANTLLAAIQLLQEQTQALSDTILLMASMLSANSPRIDAAGRMVALTETGSVISTVSTVTALTTLTNIINQGGFPTAYSMQDVPLHIYNNITVS